MDTAQILVSILAAALAIFLILAIILVAYLIKIALQIKRITSTAEQVAFRFDTVMSVMQKAAAPALITKFANDFLQRFIDKRKRKG